LLYDANDLAKETGAEIVIKQKKSKKNHLNQIKWKLNKNLLPYLKPRLLCKRTQYVSAKQRQSEEQDDFNANIGLIRISLLQPLMLLPEGTCLL
jgi:hypothetical protein